MAITNQVDATTALNQAPALPQLDTSSDNYMSNVIEYMTALLLLTVNLTKNEATVGATQANLSQAFVDLNKGLVEDAKKAYLDYEKQIEEASSSNLLSQIFGGIAMGLGILLAGITGGLTAFLVAGIITGLMFSGTFNKLDEALANSIGSDQLRSIVKMAIIVGITLVGCGIGGALDVGTEAVLANAAAQGAKQAAVNGAKQAALKAEQQVVVNLQPAGGSVANGASPAAAGAIETSAVGNSAVPRSFLDKVWDQGFSKSNRYLISGLSTTAVNPFVDQIMVFLNWSDTSEEKKKFVATLAGTILSMVIGILLIAGGTYKAAENIGAFGNFLRQKLGGPNSFLAIDIVRNLSMMAQGGFNIAEGAVGIQTADTIKQIGNNKMALIIYQGLLDIMTNGIQAETTHYQGMSKAFQQMSQTFMAFIQPYLKAAEILG